MTLKEFAYFFNENEFAKTFLTMLVLYFILIVPNQEGEDLQLAVTKGIIIVFLFCTLWWAIGNYDVVFSMIGLR